MKAKWSLYMPARNLKIWTLVLCVIFTLYWTGRLFRQQPTNTRIQHWDDDTIHSSFLKRDYLNPQGRVIYNRVGKCGSRTLVSLLKDLAPINNFKLVGTMINNQVALSIKQQMDFVNFVEKLNPPFLYHQHIHFVDFQRFGGVQPVYINMIRDPIDRKLSHYYFKRWGDERAEREFKGVAFTRNQTIDECVARSLPECVDVNQLFYIIPFFCGQNPMCREHSRWALDHAKENVKSKYLVVGILEEFEDFLLVLEKLLPQQFKGVVEMWKNPDPTTMSKIAQTQTRNKKPPSAKTRSILRKRLALEYEFYYFIKDRFRTIKLELNISTTKTQTSKGHSAWKLEGKSFHNKNGNENGNEFSKDYSV